MSNACLFGTPPLFAVRGSTAAVNVAPSDGWWLLDGGAEVFGCGRDDAVGHRRASVPKGAACRGGSSWQYPGVLALMIHEKEV